MTDEVLTIKEIAGLLRLTEKTVYSMAQRGEIPAFKVRGQWRIQRSDLQAWMESQKQSGADASSDRHRRPRGGEEGAGGRARPSRKTRAKDKGDAQ